MGWNSSNQSPAARGADRSGSNSRCFFPRPARSDVHMATRLEGGRRCEARGRAIAGWKWLSIGQPEPRVVSLLFSLSVSPGASPPADTSISLASPNGFRKLANRLANALSQGRWRWPSAGVSLVAPTRALKIRADATEFTGGRAHARPLEEASSRPLCVGSPRSSGAIGGAGSPAAAPPFRAALDRPTPRHSDP